MAEGTFRSDPKRVLYSVINLMEFGRLKQLIFEADPNAFMVVNDTAEVIGSRFLTREDQGFRTNI